MRAKMSALSFILALAIGSGLGLAPSIADWLWPSFTKDEATAKVSKRVRHRRTEKFRAMKCPAQGFCKEVREDEGGTVIGIEPVADGGYFLVVRWDEPGGHESYLSYCGRYTHRESLIEE